jgi:uncharacterized repeat protein (TIGR01451 family)
LGAAEGATADGNVNDFAYNKADGLLYGGDQDDGELAVLDPTPLNGTGTVARIDYPLTGLPVSGTPLVRYGGAWFNFSGTLYLYENVSGNIYPVYDPATTPTLGTPMDGPGSTDVDAAACAGQLVEIVKEGTPDLGTDGIADAGDFIDYTFTVTNTSTVTLTDVDVTDPLVSTITCPGGNPISSLAAFGFVTCTGSYTITQADVDAGVVTNTATSTGLDPDGDPVSDQDTHNEFFDPFVCTNQAFTVRYSPAELFEINQLTEPFSFNVIDLNNGFGNEGNVAELFIPAGLDGSAGEFRTVELNNLGFRSTDGFLYAMALKEFVAGAPAQNGNYGIVKIDSAGNIYPVAVPAPGPIPNIGNYNFANRFPAGDITPDGSTMYINAQVTGSTFPGNTLFAVNLDTLAVTSIIKTRPDFPSQTVNVADWAVNPLDGMLYGGGSRGTTRGLIFRLNPETGVINQVPGSGAIGLPTGTGSENSFGGAWCNAAGNLFLYRNGDQTDNIPPGTIYEVDLDSTTPVGGCTTAPCPELINTRTGGPSSIYNDAAACAAAEIELIKTADPTSVPEGGTADYTFTVNNFSPISVTIDTLTDSIYGDLTATSTFIDATNCALPHTLEAEGTAGDSYTCTVTANVPGTAGDEVTNIATATGTDANGNPVSAEDFDTVSII